jgi:TonB family protein
MRQLTLALLVSLFLAGALTAQGQRKKTPEQKPGVPVSADSEHPRNEVEKKIEAAREHGEQVVIGCLANCEQSSEDITQGILNGHAIKLPIPAYPPIARAAHAEGSVEVQVLIDVDGQVIAASVLNGHPLLQSTSLQSARNSVFKPTELNGQPVKVTGILRYNFKLP